MAECRHGLDEELCDVCSPKAPPIQAPTIRVSQPRRTEAPRTKVSSIRARRHVVVSIDELGAVLDGTVDAGEWSTQPLVTGFDSVVLVAPTDDVSQVNMIAVANEPARDKVRAALRGRDGLPRIGVYPPWFARWG